MTARAELRRDFDDKTRLSLLESDMDLIEKQLSALRSGQEYQTKMLVGILISLATGAILMAVNLVLLRGGHIG